MSVTDQLVRIACTRAQTARRVQGRFPQPAVLVRACTTFRISDDEILRLTTTSKLLPPFQNKTKTTLNNVCAYELQPGGVLGRVQPDQGRRR